MYVSVAEKEHSEGAFAVWQESQAALPRRPKLAVLAGETDPVEATRSVLLSLL